MIAVILVIWLRVISFHGLKVINIDDAALSITGKCQYAFLGTRLGISLCHVARFYEVQLFMHLVLVSELVAHFCAGLEPLLAGEDFVSVSVRAVAFQIYRIPQGRIHLTLRCLIDGGRIFESILLSVNGASVGRKWPI